VFLQLAPRDHLAQLHGSRGQLVGRRLFLLRRGRLLRDRLRRDRTHGVHRLIHLSDLVALPLCRLGDAGGDAGDRRDMLGDPCGSSGRQMALFDVGPGALERREGSRRGCG